MKPFEIATEIARKIESAADAACRNWNSPTGTSTRYFIVDDLLPADLVDRLTDAFPKPDAAWHHRKSFREHKLTNTRLSELDPVLQAVNGAFQEASVVGQIGRVTGIPTLCPDPSLYASGLSMMTQGHFLNPHIDNSHDAQRKRYRRLNLLFYLSPRWSETDGGNFELWDAQVQQPVELISRFNRLLVMETTPTSWHSVNAVRADRPRLCLSNYYFSPESPTGASYYHVTSFLGRPNQPLRRMVGRVDNGMRQLVANITGAGRGRTLLNDATHR